MQQPITISLIGPNAILREGLRHILADENFRITQSVDNPSQLLDRRGDDLLMVIDDGKTENCGESLMLLHRRFPDVKLVVLSDMFEFEAMAGAFRAGASGYMINEIHCEPLVGSLRLVAMGEKVMPSLLADVLPVHLGDHERYHARMLLECAQLSLRERDILACLVMGCANKVISRRLNIAESTVKVHVKAILRKLRVENRTQAAIRGVNGGLEDLPPALSIVGSDLGLPLAHLA